MCKKFEPTDVFQVEIQASTGLTYLTAFTYLIASMAILLVSPHVFLTSLFIFFLGVHAFYVIRKDCLRLDKASIIHCQQISPNIWRLRNYAGSPFSVKLIYQYRSRYLVIMIFKALLSGKKITLVLAPDAMTKQNYTLLLSRLWIG